MKFKSIFAASLLMISPAAADDMNWTGFYLGGFGGISNSGAFTDNNGFYPEHSFSGATIGIYAGYNFQVENIVFGPEISYDFGKNDGNGTQLVPAGLFPAQNFNTSSEIDELLNVNVRVGAVHESNLLYVTGGYSHANLTSNRIARNATTSAVTFGPFTGSADINGYNIGAGFERKITEKISFGLEASHVNFNNKTVSYGGGSIAQYSGLHINQIRAKLSVQLP